MSLDLLSNARKILRKKCVSLEKDYETCKTTGAMTPILLFCFSVIDYFGALYCGDASDNAPTSFQSEKYMREIMGYDSKQVKILQHQYRHKLVHLSEPQPVIEDDSGQYIGWGICWVNKRNEHLQIVTRSAPFTYTDPFGTEFEVHKDFLVSIPDFVEDICRSVDGPDGYLERLEIDPKLRNYFQIALMQKNTPYRKV